MTAPFAEETHDVNSRFRIMERPHIMPGKCAVCGGVDRPIVDFGLNIQFYGAVMLCVDCVSEAGVRVGMVRPEDNAEANLQTGQSVTEFLEAHDFKVVTRELHDALSTLVSSYIDVTATGLDSVPSRMDHPSSKGTQGKLRLVYEDDESDDSKPDADDDPLNL
jgi:hypothetical protein